MQAGDAQVANVLDATKARRAEPEVAAGLCRNLPVLGRAATNPQFLEVTTEAESTYFNHNLNHNQISTES